jgi:hypothetical protein
LSMLSCKDEIVDFVTPPLVPGGRRWACAWTAAEALERRELVLSLFAANAVFFYSDPSLTPRLATVAEATATASAATATAPVLRTDSAARCSGGSGKGSLAGCSTSAKTTYSSISSGSSNRNSSGGGRSDRACIVSGVRLRALRPRCQTALQSVGESGACMAASLLHLLLMQGSNALRKQCIGGKHHSGSNNSSRGGGYDRSNDAALAASASLAHTQALQQHRFEGKARGGGAVPDQGERRKPACH